MPLNESDTRAKLIDPALHARGWTEELIHREVTVGAIELDAGGTPRRGHGRADYTLRVKVHPDSQPVALALIEAKAESLPPTHGLEQGKLYAASKRLHVPFVFASNGHLYVEYDRFTGLTTDPRPLSQFPAPDELRARYEQGLGFSLTDAVARPLLMRYSGGETSRRYYQDAAIRAVLEKLARAELAGQPKRALLSLATGAGKTFIAVHLLKRIADAGQLRRALFVCDRDELRIQGLAAFQNVFGADAAQVSAHVPQHNARILIATYQTLNLDSDQSDASFLVANYPEDYFSHVIIDECHRSAWGKWSLVLTRNATAVQIGLTATPRQLTIAESTPEAEADRQLTADNLRYFGEAVYEYDLGQGIEDGYLALCEIHQFDLFHDNKPANERDSGVTRADLYTKRMTDALTGEVLTPAVAREFYAAQAFEQNLVLPDRVQAMCKDLFDHLLATGGPEQKTIIFCARDYHADAVATAMNNLYAQWRFWNPGARAEPYAFKCTQASGGSDLIAELKGASRRHEVATTVDLLTTGVDVPPVRNIVFFKYVRSPIAFHQMLGRGTRIDVPTDKLMFRVYDYTDATRLFGQDFLTRYRARREGPREPSREPTERTIVVQGFDVRVGEAGHLIPIQQDGRTVLVTVEAYKERLAARLLQEAPSLDAFRARWIDPTDRRALLDHLPEGNRSAYVVRELEQMKDYDLYDVLGELGYGLAPRTRADRSDAFAYKHATWLDTLPPPTSDTLRALAHQFALAGTDGLETPEIFQTPEVTRAGGLAALRALGRPAEVLRETKERIFAV